MKILMVCDVYLNFENAPSIHVMEVFKNIRRFSVAYLIAPKSYTFIQRFPQSVKTILYNIHRLLFNFSAFAQLSRHILISKEPIVIYSRHWFLGLSLTFVSKLFKVPLIIEVNGLAIDEYNMLSKMEYFPLLKYIIFWCEKLILSSSEKVVSITSNLKKEIIEIYNISPDKIVIIPNGVDVNVFKPLDQRKIREELRLDNNKIYIVYVGSLSSDQGIDYLIRASPFILKKFSNIGFIIVGDGPLKQELVKLVEKIGISDKFIFTGKVPHKDVPKYINVGDVCVTFKKPLKEASPLKLYEYMACAKPIVASKISGCEIVNEANSGILVEPEDSEKLARTIVKLLLNKKLREEMGRNGRETVVKEHSWKAVARKIVSVCRETLLS